MHMHVNVHTHTSVLIVGFHERMYPSNQYSMTLSRAYKRHDMYHIKAIR